jgi:hypothetical protein
MTAINPARLKIQSAKVAESFLDSNQFINELHGLFTFYAARIRQTSLSRAPLALQAYQIPAPVIMTLELELSEIAKEHPEKSLELVDELWKEDWVEFRQLAVLLLGLIPINSKNEILRRIRSWVKTSPTEELRQQVIIKGLQGMMAEKPEKVLDMLKKMAASKDKKDLQGALYGLIPFVEDPDFENFPTVYKILSAILLPDDQILIKEISTIIRALQRRSDQETANFLVRQLSTASKPRISRITRQVLKYFSKESQELLREGLVNHA